MPAEFLFEILLRFVFELIAYAVGYLTGSVIVPLFSLGAYSVEPFEKPVRGKRRQRRKRSRPEDRPPRTVLAETTTIVGLLFWVLVAIIAYLAMRSAGV
ncbi:hypothetical protein [Arenimonas sp.]|uniref:hypothetical protein n=1 Tax=Arenimonas sp. TaxID=1872635 RepID=UPI0039E59C28